MSAWVESPIILYQLTTGNWLTTMIEPRRYIISTIWSRPLRCYDDICSSPSRPEAAVRCDSASSEVYCIFHMHVPGSIDPSVPSDDSSRPSPPVGRHYGLTRSPGMFCHCRRQPSATGFSLKLSQFPWPRERMMALSWVLLLRYRDTTGGENARLRPIWRWLSPEPYLSLSISLSFLITIGAVDIGILHLYGKRYRSKRLWSSNNIYRDHRITKWVKSDFHWCYSAIGSNVITRALWMLLGDLHSWKYAGRNAQ